MPFLTYCENKDCRKYQPPVLDETNNTVVCSECEATITNITDFAKRQLKTLGQVLKSSGQHGSFSVRCTKCSSQNTPVRKGDEFFCQKCSFKLSLSHAFTTLIKLHIKE